MSKRTAGVMFCLIAGGLFAIRYIVAALFMSGVSSWNATILRRDLNIREMDC